MHRSAALALLVALLGCSNPFGPPPREADDLRLALVDQVRAKDAGEHIRLSDAWPGDWDRAAVLPPYSSDSIANDLLGFPFAYERASPWTYTEGGVVIVLATGNEVLAWFKVPSADLSLHCAPELVPRDNDQFTVHRLDGFVGLGPDDRSDCV